MSSKSSFLNSTSKSYALALYELAKENSELKKVEDEMIGLKILLRESSDFEEMTLDPTVTKEEKNKVIIEMADQYGFCQTRGWSADAGGLRLHSYHFGLKH